MPCWRQCSRSPVRALAVRAMIGVRGFPELSFELPDQPGCGEAVHHRHLAVHEDRIETSLADRGRQPHCRRGMNRSHAHALERRGGDEGVHRVVFDQKYGFSCEPQHVCQGLSDRAGTDRALKALRKQQRDVKMLPRAIALFTRTFPPIASAVAAKLQGQVLFRRSFSTSRTRPGRTARTGAESCRLVCRCRYPRCGWTSLTPSGVRFPRKRRVTPPIDVNLIALLTKFITTRRSFSSSATDQTKDPLDSREASKRRLMPFAVALAWNVWTATWHTRRTSIGAK